MNILNDKKIVFIGGGNMAQALISGLISSGMPANNITVSDPAINEHQDLLAKGIVATTPNTDKLSQALKETNVVMLAVKPQVMQHVVTDFAELLDDQLVISIAAGLSTQTLSNMLSGYKNIVRVMPNTPSMIQKGAAGLFAPNNITEDYKNLAEAVMAASGIVSWVDDEQLLHAVTAVSGSAPAYFFYMFESMIDAGVGLGLNQKQSADLAIQTALGAAQMALGNDDTPAELRRKVTSPNGTTHEAMESLKQSGFKDIIKQAMQACYNRSDELSKELDYKP